MGGGGWGQKPEDYLNPNIILLPGTKINKTLVKDRHAGQSASLSLKIYTVLYIVHTVYVQFIATGWQCTENQSRFSEIK